jgi:predicted flap endonuclease-1-like 5' DNA nuclease
MLEIFCGAWWPYLLAFLIGLATAYWAFARSGAVTVAEPVVKMAPEPIAVPKPVVKVPVAAAAAAAVPLMAAANPKAVPKPKLAPVKKVAVKAAAPKPVAKPVAKLAAAPKAAAPKVKVAVVATPKVAVPKAKAPAVKLAVVAKPKAAVKPKPAAKPKSAPKPRIPDNLELLKGVGPKLNALLKSLGITTFDQVANWTAPDIADIDAKLGNFAGRIGRDNWVDQAKLLVKGDVAAFEKKYGSLGSEISKG